MRNSTIIVSTGRSPSGVFREGIVKSANTFYPGMVVQRDPTVALVEGVPTYKIYDSDADGGRPKGALWVVTETLQIEQGKNITDSIAAGERVMCYSPRAGEELNLLLGDVAGTGSASDFDAGDILIVDDGTGVLIFSSGTPETEVAMMLESIADMTANTLGWVEWTGF